MKGTNKYDLQSSSSGGQGTCEKYLGKFGDFLANTATSPRGCFFLMIYEPEMPQDVILDLAENQ